MDIVLDAGHGGFDNGATYQGRKEKEDVLRLTMAVGERLERDGYTVYYTRTEDVYNSPYEKAQIANETGADYFISFHRNDSLDDNQYNGIQSLVYSEESEAIELAENINRQLAETGFNNIGIEERPGLVVLRRTEMPAVLVEAGFINSTVDNEIFDEKFNEVVNAIVTGIEETIPIHEVNLQRMQPENKQNDRLEEERMMNDPLEEERMMNDPLEEDRMMNERLEEDRLDDVRMNQVHYAVQTGLFRYRNNALYLAEELRRDGFTPEIGFTSPYYMVFVRSRGDIEEAKRLQRELQRKKYDTLIIVMD